MMKFLLYYNAPSKAMHNLDVATTLIWLVLMNNPIILELARAGMNLPAQSRGRTPSIAAMDRQLCGTDVLKSSARLRSAGETTENAIINSLYFPSKLLK